MSPKSRSSVNTDMKSVVDFASLSAGTELREQADRRYLNELIGTKTIKLIRGAEKALVCVDPTDTDNIELAVAVASYFGIENTCIVLTGRCALHPDDVARRVAAAAAEGIPAHHAIPINEWDRGYSELLLKVSALRFEKALQLFGHHSEILIVDGGIAKAPKIPHGVHMNDLLGFKDVSEDEVLQVKAGQIECLSERGLLMDFVGNKNFIAFLGGPATGLNLVFEDYPVLKQHWVGLFGQYGSLGSVKGMRIEGRTEGAQFNVALDATSGRSLFEKAEESSVPCFLLPTDVTRNAQIGIGDSSMMDFLCKSDNPGMLHLANMREIWEEEAIRSRPGEVLLTHDLATLFMYFQVVGEAGRIYDLQSVKSAKIITKGPREGVIDFSLGRQKSNLFVSTELLDPRGYLEEVRKSLVEKRLEDRQRVFLSTSLSAEDQADSAKLLEYEARVAAKIGPLLREGAEVHFGCHPAVLRIMNEFARRYPGQIVPHLLEKYRASRELLSAVNDKDFHWHDSDQPDYMDHMIAEMVAGCDTGVFVGGRRDVSVTESGESELLYEFTALLWSNPDVQLLIDDEFDGIASELELARNVSLLARMIGKKRLGRILSYLEDLQ